MIRKIRRKKNSMKLQFHPKSKLKDLDMHGDIHSIGNDNIWFILERKN